MFKIFKMSLNMNINKKKKIGYNWQQEKEVLMGSLT